MFKSFLRRFLELTVPQSLLTDITLESKLLERNKFKQELMSHLTASLDLDATVQGFASHCVASFADFCFIEVFDENGKSTSATFAAKDPLQANEASRAIVEHSEFQAVLRIPIEAHERQLGLLTLIRKPSSRPFEVDEHEFATDFTRKAALAIANAKLYLEAKDANRAKDQFLATLSHELRTPMNVILGWLEILSTEEVDPQTYAAALETLNRNAKTQIQLINDLLDVSRAINGKLALNTRPVDLTQITRESIEGFHLPAKKKKIDLTLDIGHEVCAIEGDAERIQQILANLISNAIKFTPEKGSITVALECKPEEYWISVRDSGLGIEAKFLPFVFERFRQETPSSAQNGGLGLGLSIVKYLTELHGGRIWVSSNGRNTGANFVVALPKSELSVSLVDSVRSALADLEDSQAPRARLEI